LVVERQEKTGKPPAPEAKTTEPETTGVGVGKQQGKGITTQREKNQ